MINSIVGLMSSGKTLYMTYLLWLDWLKGKTIITNYDLNFPHYKINQDWLLDLVNNEDVILKNVSIGLDELWLWLMDSRSSMGKDNKLASYFFLQSSKDDSNIYITAQDNSQNDKRLKQNIHTITQCNRILIFNNVIIGLDEGTRFLEKKYGDWINEFLYIEAKVYTRKLDSYGIIELKHSITDIVPAKFVFPFYDTSKKMKPKVIQ